MDKKLEELLNKPVLIQNDKERDAIFEIYEKEGIVNYYYSRELSYPYSLSCRYSLSDDKYRVVCFCTAFNISFKDFMDQYNKLTSTEPTKRNFLTKEKIKNLKAGVLITNDRERGEFLSICQEAGVRWRNMEDATDYKPESDYPYMVYCNPSEIIYDGDDDVLMFCCSLDEVNYPTISFDEFKTRLNNHQYEIVISCYDGKTTTARMMIDGKEVRNSEAKRVESDKFNWGIGAKLAAERLWEKEVKDEVKNFDVGDRVQVHKNFPYTDTKYLIGKIGTVVRVNERNVGIEFDDINFYGHDLGGAISSRRGWWIAKNYLKKIK